MVSGLQLLHKDHWKILGLHMEKYGDIIEPAMEDWLIPSDYSIYGSSAVWGYFRLKDRSH